MTEDTKPGLIAGRLITFSEGEYSDFGYMGTFVSLETVSMDALRKIADEIEQNIDKTSHADRWEAKPLIQFQAELIRRGYLLEVENHVIHLGLNDELDLD